jgi:hypothetical protein
LERLAIQQFGEVVSVPIMNMRRTFSPHLRVLRASPPSSWIGLFTAGRLICMTAPSINRYPVPKLEDLPEDIRARMLAVQEKAGFIPSVFLTLVHRPDEWPAFSI